MIFGFFLIHLISIKSCPIDQSQVNLIPEGSFFTSNTFDIPEPDQNGDSFGIGYWSLNVPRYTEFMNQAQILFQLNQISSAQYSIIAMQQVFFDKKQYSIQIYYYPIGSSTNQKLVFLFDYSQYQAAWIFTFITFKLKENKVIVNVKDQEQYIDNQIVIANEKYKLIQGNNEEVYNIDPSKIQLYFRGRLSNLITHHFFYSEQTILDIQNNCQISQQIIGEQVVYIIQGTTLYQDEQTLTFQTFQLGQKYLIKGWVKYSTKNVFNPETFRLIRLTNNRIKKDNFGDDLFTLEVTFNPFSPKQSKIKIYIDSFCQNNIGDTACLFHYTIANVYQYLTYIFQDYSSLDFYEGLTNWHYLQYEYGRNNQTHDVLSIQIKLYNLPLIQQSSSNQYIDLYLIGNMFIIFNEQEVGLNSVQGMISNLQFTHNYYDDKDFLLGCDYSCSTCYGPLNINCLTCETKNNRFFNKDLESCQCNDGYEDQGNQMCFKIQEKFQSVIQQDMLSTINHNQCPFGYFMIQTKTQDIICQECPQSEKETILCVECIFNPDTWYLQPICTRDLVQRGKNIDDAFYYYNRQQSEVDMYLIDDNNMLKLHEGYSSFCQSSEDDCHLSLFSHLGQQVYIICKQNYQFSENDCVQKDISCSIYDSLNNCIECKQPNMFIQNKTCQVCPKTCNTCVYDSTQEIPLCTSCIEKKTLFNGLCYNCGLFCLICQMNKSQNLKKCLKCIDDSKYYLSVDGENCQENDIDGCKYAVQFVTGGFKDFSAQENSLVTVCASCDPYQIYNVQQNICVEDPNKYDFDPVYYPITCNFKIIQLDGMENCLVSVNQMSPVFSLDCQSFVSNCYYCIHDYMQGYQAYRCILCYTGYYADRIEGNCVSCSSIQNCSACGQQQKIAQDYWIWALQPFLIHYIELHDNILKIDQSKNLDDYEIVCFECIQGYEIYNGQCIVQCPENCYECAVINQENVCVRCKQTVNGRMLSLYNNQCIICPQNCALCRQRNSNEVKLINPLFQSDEFSYYSNQCLRSFSDYKNYIYDDFLGAFVICEHKNLACSHQLIIPLNLYCDIHQYQYDLNQQPDDQKMLFRQKNILLDDLTSAPNFQEFENSEFYNFANQNYYRSIRIVISSNQPLSCGFFQNNIIIDQKFGDNIFSVTNVEISFNFTFQTTFSFSKIITFKNFNTITLSGIEIRLGFQNKKTGFNFFGVYPINLYFLNTKILRINKSGFFITISGANFTSIDNVQFINLQEDFLIQITSNINVLGSKQFRFTNLTFQDCNFQNQKLFNLNLDSNDMINFEQIQITGNHLNTSFLVHDSQLGNQQLYVRNLFFQGSLIGSQKFLEFDVYKSLQIEGLGFLNSKINNSNLISLNCYNSLSSIKLLNNQIFQNTTFINNFYVQECNQTINITEINLENNEYDSSIYFIRLRNINKFNSYVQIDQLLILNNFAPSILKALQQIEKALVYIVFEQIRITNIKIAKGYGMTDISISNALDVRIQHAEIYADQFKILGLHQFLDCVLRVIDSQIFKEALFIYDSKLVLFEDFNVTSLTIFDSPVISYKSAELFQTQINEIINFKNITMKNNLIISTDSQKSTALIQIITQQVSQLSLENVELGQNILHEYIQNSLSIPSAIICIIGEFSILGFKTLYFEQNIITNSTDSLLYINCKNVTMIDGTFKANNIFNYEVIQKHLLWGYDYQFKTIYQENIEAQFQILSLTGNGIYQVEKIFIQNCNFINSSGKQSGAIQIKLKNIALVEIYYTNFISILNSFNENAKTGGTLYIDMENSQKANIKLYNIEAQNIFSRTLGGLFYFEQGDSLVNIYIHNILISNVYSMQGSIIYASFSKKSQYFKYIEIADVNSTNTIAGQLQFLSYFTNILQEEYNNLIYERSLLYIDYITQLRCQHITITGLLFEQVLAIISISQIYLENIVISSCQLSTKLFYINPNNYQNLTIYFSTISLSSISLGFVDYSFQCLTITQKPSQQSSKCLSYKTNSPLTILSQENHSQNMAQCIFNILAQTLSSQTLSNSSNFYVYGLMVFDIFTQPTNFRFSKINIQTINCTYCQQGLISLTYSSSQDNIELSTIQLLHTNCGLKGCINLQRKFENERILQIDQKNLGNQRFSIILKNIQCFFNIAQNGVCLNLQNSSILLQDSIFKNNSATYLGGSVYHVGNQMFLLFSNIIQNNKASVGGGIYFQGQRETNNLFNSNIIQNNFASQFGNNVYTQPEKLLIQVQKDQKNSLITLVDNNYMQIDQIQFQSNNTFIQSLNFQMVPSGQQLQSYSFFNWKTSSYTPGNFIFRILAVTKELEQVQSLSNSNCTIKSRKFDTRSLSSETYEYSNNYTNINEVSFNIETQDYNLDDLVIYFDSDQPANIVLQLEISCDSIVIPIFNSSFPYNLISSHQNYKLRANFRTLSCQYGEIKNLTDSSCHVCDSNSGLFSLTINSSKCELQDDQTTVSVKPAQLQLRAPYWRPYFSTSDVERCKNFEPNCLGGWIEGDTSCSIGHIGALCEQCDLYNIRGNGQFSISDQYQCGRCSEQTRNAIMVVIVIIWIMISLFISTTGVLKAQEEYLKPSPFFKIRFTRNLNKSQSSALIKILTSYLQIIISITTFQLDFPTGFRTTVNAVGNPIQTMAYSLDCFLAGLFNIDIQYARMIWQLITPFFYVTVFIALYKLAAKFKMAAYSFSVFCTSLLYISIYFQPNLIGGLIQLLSFREISGFKWIQANVSLRYDTIIHLNWMLKFCLPILILLSIILPCYLFWSLYKNRFHLEEKSVRNAWSYLYNEYKTSAYFWEIIKILEKELVIIILNFYEDSIVIKGVIIQFITYLYCEMNRLYSPYFLKNLNTLDYYSANICMITIGLAIGAYISQTQTQYEIKGPIYIVMAIINFQFLVQIMLKILAEYIKLIQHLLQMMRTKISIYFPSITNNSFLSKHIFKTNVEQQRMEQIFFNFRIFSRIIGKQALEQKKYIFDSNCSGRILTTSATNQQDLKFLVFKQPQSKVIIEGIDKHFTKFESV